MYSRIARYEVPPERLDEAVRAFDEAARGLSELDGSLGGYLLVDREGGTAMTLTLWADQESMSRSEVAAAALRRRAVASVEGDVHSVECFEVAVDFTRAASSA